MGHRRLSTTRAAGWAAALPDARYHPPPRPRPRWPARRTYRAARTPQPQRSPGGVRRRAERTTARSCRVALSAAEKREPFRGTSHAAGRGARDASCAVRRDKAHACDCGGGYTHSLDGRIS
eukprot:2258997-Prymnesium_polylepis.1